MGYETYVGISREQLLVKMQHLLPEKRFKHCLGVEQAAIDLAERFGVDVEKAGLAGLLHDYAKKLSDEEFLALIDKYDLDPKLKDWGNNVWHGMVGIYKIQDNQRSCTSCNIFRIPCRIWDSKFHIYTHT